MRTSRLEKSTNRQTRYADVLAVRPFRALFAGSTLSIVGTSLQILALSVLIYSATGSAVLSALAYGAGFLPQAVGGALFTSLADRVPARRLIVTGCLVQAGVALTLAAAPLSAGASIALVAAAASLQPLFSAAQATMLPRLLLDDRYVLGRSLLTLASASAQLAGLAAGGALIALLGGRPTILAAATAQLLAAIVAGAGLPGGGGSEAVRQGRWALGDTWKGNAALLRDSRIRGLLFLFWLPPALLVGAEALVVPYVGERGAPAGTAGWLLATMPAGMFLGNLAVGRFCTAARRERLVRPLMLLMGVPLLALTAHPSMLLTAALLGSASAGFAYQLGRQQAFLDAVPPSARGLAFGLLSTGLMTGQGLGPVAGGALAGWLGAGPTMALAGVGIIVTALLLRTDASSE
jgi:predicted MFS family arabinose efflux permease